MLKQTSILGRPGFSRRPSGIDRILSEAGRALQVLSGSVHPGRPGPAGKPEQPPASLATADKDLSVRLMRVNHVGEVCAQALYRGQALFCRDDSIKNLFWQAASEEVDHLAWCRDRLTELQGRPSYLNPLWYAGSFSLGVLASSAGIPRNLGFMAETESQVEQHLNSHLTRLPPDDERSRRIVEQMRDDEIRHGTTAHTHGARPLAAPARLAMKAMSKIMTTTAYWL